MSRCRILACHCFALLLLLLAGFVQAQTQPVYRNPVLFADYSDPDVICVGD